MSNHLKNIFIKSYLTALAWAFFIVGLDICFCLSIPRSLLTSGQTSLNEKIFIFAIDGVLSFALIFFLLFSRIVISRWLIYAFGYLLGIFYLINWATFLVVSDFLQFEGIRFVYHNFEQVLWLMAQVSTTYVITLLTLIVSPLLIIQLRNWTNKLLPKQINSFKNIQMPLIRISLVLFLLITVLSIIFWQNLTKTTVLSLKFRTSPQLSLFFNPPTPEMQIDYTPGMPRLISKYNLHMTWDQYTKGQNNHAPDVPVIVIVVESLRNDVLDNPMNMPNLYDLKKNALSFKAYTTSNVTDYAWPAIFLSQYPLRSSYHYYYPRKTNYPKITIYDVLKEFGYHTAIFSAQNENWSGMVNILKTKSLDTFFSSDFPDEDQYVPQEDRGFTSFVKGFKTVGKLDDGRVADEATQWIAQQKTANFFIGINFQRPHFPYTWPETFHPPFPYGQPDKWFYPRGKILLMRGRYANALRYTDEQIGKIVASLKAQGLYEKSLIIVTGDHGEAFYDHGTTCHANELFNETAKTIVVFKAPTQGQDLTMHKVPELLDIAPTILDILKLPAHPSFQGQSWFTSQPIKRPIFITVNSPVANQDAIIVDDWKLINDHRNNRKLLFNLQIDPKENNNLFFKNPNQANFLLYQLMTWRKEQFKYYNDVSLQKKYYPPRFSSE